MRIRDRNALHDHFAPTSTTGQFFSVMKLPCCRHRYRIVTTAAGVIAVRIEEGVRGVDADQ